MGTGRDAYVALSDDDLVALTRGEQAGGRLDGFHIFMGLALTGVSREEITAVTFQIADVDGAVRAEVVRSGPMSGFLGDDGVRLVVAGVQPRIDDCCAVANGEVDLRGAVDLSDGTRLEDGVRVRTGQCLDGAVDVCE